jgi:hypothetical protein
VSAQGGAEGTRRVEADLSAPSRCPDDGDGTAQWDRWYGYDRDRTESPYDGMRRAFLAGWAERDTAVRRKAADELTALYGGGAS